MSNHPCRKFMSLLDGESLGARLVVMNAFHYAERRAIRDKRMQAARDATSEEDRAYYVKQARDWNRMALELLADARKDMVTYGEVK